MSTVRVYGPHGEALHPCHPARARQLLRNQRATVISTRPYAIRLSEVPTEPASAATESGSTGDGHAREA